MIVRMEPQIHLHQRDLPSDIWFDGEIAVDFEMMGLNLYRDRVCLVQLRGRDGDVHLVQIHKGQTEAPRLKKVLEDPKSLKLLQYARIDMGYVKHWLGIDLAPVFCTKIASYLARTYTGHHGIRALCKDYLDVSLNKEYSTTNWGLPKLSKEQLQYAADDVLYLHQVYDCLVEDLKRVDRYELAQKCCDFLPTKVELDLAGFTNDVFVYKMVQEATLD